MGIHGGEAEGRKGGTKRKGTLGRFVLYSGSGEGENGGIWSDSPSFFPSVLFGGGGGEGDSPGFSFIGNRVTFRDVRIWKEEGGGC